MNEAIALGQVNGRPHTHTEEVVRLDALTAEDWRHFPRFMERCDLFAEILLGYTKMQLMNFEQDLRNRWATPNANLFLAAMDATGVMVGHLLGWINVDYGQPYLFIFQAEVDKHYTMTSRLLDGVFSAVSEHLAWANAMYEKGGQNVRINKVRMQTWRHADAFVRYLEKKGIAAVVERSVIGWDV